MFLNWKPNSEVETESLCPDVTSWEPWPCISCYILALHRLTYHICSFISVWTWASSLLILDFQLVTTIHYVTNILRRISPNSLGKIGLGHRSPLWPTWRYWWRSFGRFCRIVLSLELVLNWNCSTAHQPFSKSPPRKVNAVKFDHSPINSLRQLSPRRTYCRTVHHSQIR